MFGIKAQPVQTIAQPTPTGKYAAMLIAAKIAKAMAKASFKASYWVSRHGYKFGYTHRRKLAPVYTFIALQTTAFGLHILPDGLKTTTALAAVGAVTLGGWMYWWRPKIGRPLKANATWWKDAQIRAWAFFGACTLWTTTAVATTPGPPMNGILLALTAAGGGMWWWRHRIRPQADTVTLDEAAQTWKEDVEAAGGILPGAQIVTHKHLYRKDDPATEIGQKLHVQLKKGKQTTSMVMGKTEQFASLFGVAPAEIAVEPVTNRRADQAVITIYKQNALKREVPFAGPIEAFDSSTGLAIIGSYPDGEDVLYRFYRHGSGPIHDLISGTTGSGKSRLLDLLLSIERHSPLMTSIVIDPQGGQSLPDWAEAVPVFARSVHEGAAVIAGVEEEMFRRNRILAEVEWVDSKGRTRIGKSYFEPTPEMPLLCLTIDEAHLLLADSVVAKMVENIAKMARKCGIKLRLVTQVPLLDQLGGSTTLRDMVAAGNVIVLRTANKLTGQVAFNGNIAADPVSIPQEFDDFSTTSGIGYALTPGARSSVMRAGFVEDPYDWASTGEMTTAGSEGIAIWLRQCRAATEMISPEAKATPEQVQELVKAVKSEPMRILQYLQERGGPAHTGVIAERLDIPRANVSTALKRLAGKGQVVKVKHGIWEAAEVVAKPVLVAA